MRQIRSFFNPLVSALYHFFFKNEHLGHYLLSYVYKIKSKHLLRLLMPWSQCERHIATILRQFAPNLILFEPLVTALYHFFLENKNLGHYPHSYVYKIKSKPCLLFLMSWSQRERHIATILRHFAPNLIIFEPLVSALYHFFLKTNTWGIISIPMSIRSNQNIVFVFLCLGHSVSDTLQPFLAELGQI